MKNVFKFLRGKIAKIIVTDNIVNIERQDGQSVIFEANRNNYFIDFNVGTLGGDIERNAHEIMVVVDSNPVDFISGEDYLINDIEYYSDVKGKAKIDYDDTFFELFLDLSNGTIATAQPNCNGQTLSKMIVPIPPHAEQKRIVDKIDEIFAKL